MITTVTLMQTMLSGHCAARYSVSALTAVPVWMPSRMKARVRSQSGSSRFLVGIDGDDRGNQASRQPGSGNPGHKSERTANCANRKGPDNADHAMPPTQISESQSRASVRTSDLGRAAGSFYLQETVWMIGRNQRIALAFQQFGSCK